VKPVRFHDEAKADFAHETLYYNAFSKALAEKFVKAVEDAVALASESPAMGSKHKFGTRRYYLKKFPFSLVYVDRGPEIYVLALAPFARKPGYWRTRRNDI
jgi:toxin ParE1/3/4